MKPPPTEGYASSSARSASAYRIRRPVSGGKRGAGRPGRAAFARGRLL